MVEKILFSKEKLSPLTSGLVLFLNIWIGLFLFSIPTCIPYCFFPNNYSKFIFQMNMENVPAESEERFLQGLCVATAKTVLLPSRISSVVPFFPVKAKP